MWTGRELLVWGGESGLHGEDLHADGAAYDPHTGRWRTLPPSPLSARAGQAAAWTGSEMIIWGGYDRVSADQFQVTSSGAAYDPATSTWRRLPQAPLSPRAYAIAVWTGGTLVLLGGQPAILTDTVRGYRDGAVFNPALNRWQHIAPPTPPDSHPLTWRAAVNADGQLLAWSEWEMSRRTGPNAMTDSGGVDLFTYREDTGRWRPAPAAAGMLPDAEEVLWTGQSAVVRGIPYNCGACPGPWVPEATDLYNCSRTPGPGCHPIPQERRTWYPPGPEPRSSPLIPAANSAGYAQATPASTTPTSGDGAGCGPPRSGATPRTHQLGPAANSCCIAPAPRRPRRRARRACPHRQAVNGRGAAPCRRPSNQYSLWALPA